MKEETAAFSKIPPIDQNRFENRISFLYLEYSKIVQNKLGVVAYSEENGKIFEKKIPVAQIAVLALGPGTSITNPAVTSASRSGCTVMFTGGGGFPLNTVSAPLTSSSRWAVAQAMVISNKSHARAVAKEFYKKQFNNDAFKGSISQMRSMEGNLIKKMYAYESKKHGLKFFKRDTAGNDNVNVALNISNALLYGISASCINSLAMSESLGIIHRGNVKAFLFDIADLYKLNISIPVAFSSIDQKSENLPSYVRRKTRALIMEHKIMQDLPKFIISVFEPYLPEQMDDRLISGYGEDVEGHVNYGEK